MKRFYKFSIFTVALAFLLSISGCGLFDSPKSDSSPSDSASTGTVSGDFTAGNADTLKIAIISTPESIALTDLAKSKPSNINAVLPRMAPGGSMDDVFAGIPLYIGLAEIMKSSVATVLVDMIPLLAESVEGEFFTLTSTNPLMPKIAKVEKGTGYDWKVSGYYAGESTPKMILQFSIKTGGIKGRCLWSRPMQNYFYAQAGFTTKMPVYLDLIFDGSSTVQTMDIKFHQDLSLGRAWATQDGSLTLNDLASANIAQPDKVFLHLTSNGTEFTVNGISYHPGWATQETLGVTIPGWGAKRTMYLFKAKATSDFGGAAKLYLALPEDDRTDMTGVWDDSSLSYVVGSIFTAVLNAFIDAIADNASPSAATLAAQVITGDYNIKSHVAGETITRKHLLDFAQNGSSDYNDLHAQIRSVLYLVNPAFYTASTGFLGTYNADLGTQGYYKYSSTTGQLSRNNDGPFIAIIDKLNAYNLSDVVPYVPATVKVETITVE